MCLCFSCLLLDEDEDLEVLQRHLANEGRLKIRVVKSVLCGPPGVGKTSTRKRIIGEITNLESCPPFPSTGIEKPTTFHLYRKTERASVLVSESSFGWRPQGLDSQLEVLIHRILGQDGLAMFPYQDTTPSPVSSRASSRTSLSSSLGKSAEEPSVSMEVQQSGDSIYSQFPPSATIPPSLPKASGHATDFLPASSPPPTKRLELPEFVKKVLSEHSWEKITDSLLEIEDFTIMHITDTGGQPEFQDIIPALMEGPSLYLVFLNLMKSLEDKYEISYRKEDGKPTMPAYWSQFTGKEMLYQVLSGVASNKSAAALLIGTHLDQVNSSKVQELDSHIQTCLRSTDFFHHDLVKTVSGQDDSTRVIFPINNKDGTKNEIEQLRCHLQQTVENNFDSVELPTSWLLFHLVLRQQYEETPGFCTMEECQVTAVSCGIQEKNISVVLQFLHKNFGTLLYYRNVASMRDIIICDPNVLFDPITRLIGELFGANPGHPNRSRIIRDSGEIPKDVIKEVSGKKISGLLTYDHILDLLQQRNIISQIRVPGSNDTTCFMPCLLRSDPEVGKEGIATLLGHNPSPLLIAFRTGYVPMGLFPALVVKLSQKNDWELEENNARYKNRISFIIDKRSITSVELQSHLSHLEIRVKKSKHCARVFSDVTEALDDVMQSLNHTKDLKYEVGFYCPQDRLSLHIAICMDTENPEMMKCACPSTLSKVLPQHGVWFPKYQVIRLYLHQHWLLVCLSLLNHFNRNPWK